MTRETKVGVAVATTFLCLVSLVVASKLRRPDDLMSYEPQEPPTGAASPDPVSPVAQGGAQPAEPPPIKPSGPPSLKIESPAMPSFARPMPDLATPLPPVPSPPPIAQVSPGKKAEPPPPKFGSLDVVVPSITPDPLVPVPSGPRPFVGPLPERQGPGSKVVVQRNIEPKKGPTTPPVDPFIGALPAVAPIEQKDPLVAFPSIAPPAPLESLPKDPKVVLPAPIQVGIEPKDPMPAPSPVAAKPVAPARTSDPPVAIKDPLVPATPPPLTLPVPPPPAATKPIVIGAIGTTGGEVPITPPLTPMGPGPVASVPAVGASVTMPAIAPTGRELPKVSSHADDVRYTTATDASFEQLSKQHYGTAKYAPALLEYNRQHLLNRSNANLKQNPPVLQPNQAIFYPSPNLLESQYSRLIATPVVAGPPVVQISPPMPFTGANPPTADPTRSYTVPQTQHIIAIAQQTLGSGNQWTEILRLNPTLRTDQDIPAGTVLRLPANARVN